MESLLSIGACARAAGLSTSALRFYDAHGLLTPAHVDPSTGYRYYTSAQQESARLLATMRAADVSLLEMRRVLAAAPSQRADLLRQIADARLAEATAAATVLRRTADDCAAGVAHARVARQELRDALVGASALTSEAPFDDVLLHLRDSSLRCLATDRYRLADMDVTTHDAAGTATCALGPKAMRHILDLLELCAGDALLTVEGTHVTLDGTSIQGNETTDLPALAELADSFVDAATHHTVVHRDVEPPGFPRVDPDYLQSAFDVLAADDLTLAAPDDYGPVVLTHPLAPANRVIIMPLRDS